MILSDKTIQSLLKEGTLTISLLEEQQIQPGRRIGQLVFAKMDQEALHPYRGKYQGQRGAVGSRVYLDADSTDG